MAPRTARGDAGFSLPEMMISMGIMLVVLAGTFTAMTTAMNAEQTASNLTTMNGHLRSSMDLVVRDFLQVGQGLPVGRVIGIPNGPGAAQITRPGPAAAGGCAGVTPFPAAPTISAVTVGPDLGPPINGQCTDVITTLAHDGVFDNVNVTAIAVNGRSLTVYPYGPDDTTGTPDDVIIDDAPDALGDNIRVGDLLEVTKGATSVLVAVTAPWVAELLGARQDVLAGAVGYLRASAVGIPFLYLSFAGNGHLIGLADTRTPLRIAVSANVLNVALEVLLVYGLHLGLLGSAWGTVIAQAAAAAWYGAASRRAAVRPRRPGRAEVAALLRDGHQLSVRTIALGVVPLTTTAIAARLGPVALGGQQIAMRVWYLLALLLDALAVPAQVYVSSSLGAGDPDGAHRVGRRHPLGPKTQLARQQREHCRQRDD